MKNIEKEVEICEGKLNVNTNININMSIYNNPKCDGYDTKCENYRKAPHWREKD